MSSDLIAIANAELAEKLRKKSALTETKNQERDSDPEKDHEVAPFRNADFEQDIWKAVYTLNLMRYALGIGLLISTIVLRPNSPWGPIHPSLFLLSSILFLTSAIAFTYFSRQKVISFNQLVLMQFSTDVLLAAMMTHSYGSIESNFAVIFFIVVATGSVVLPRVAAVGLASGAIIALFIEHFYSVLLANHIVAPNYSLLAQYGLLLLTSALIIAYLAQRIRLAEMEAFVPGNESIDDYLRREETNALRIALAKTSGNKTEAAKLLGMSFRSFRYKVSKYEIGQPSDELS